MAHHASAKKRIRQTLKRRARNRFLLGSVRTKVKGVRRALDQGDQGTAEQLLQAAVSGLDRMVTKGGMHRRTASRKISRLMRAVAQKTQG